MEIELLLEEYQKTSLLFRSKDVAHTIDFLEKYNLVNIAYKEYYLHKDKDYIIICDQKRNKEYTFETSYLQNVLSWMWYM